MSYRKFSEIDPFKEEYDSEVFDVALHVIETNEPPYDEDIIFEAIQELKYPKLVEKYEIELGFIEDISNKIKEMESDKNEEII